MTMRSQLLTIKRYISYACTGQEYGDSEAATEITLAGLKQPFCFCSVVMKITSWLPACIILGLLLVVEWQKAMHGVKCDSGINVK